MAIAVSDMARRAAVEAIRNAPYGQRSMVKRQQAAALGVSEACLDRWARNLHGRVRAIRSDKGQRKIENIEEATQTVASYLLSFPKDERRISTEDAITACESMGKIPEGLLAPNTCNQIMRELGIALHKDPCVRMEPKRVNDHLHVDGSGSEYFYVIEQLLDGDYLLGARWSFEKSKKNYRVLKNPRRKKEDGRLQVYYYGAVDGHSRALWLNVQVAAGENLNDVVAAMERVMRGGGASPIRGIPRKIITDNGPLGKNQGQAMCDALGITLYTNEAYNKKANGKIERQWSLAWTNYELPLCKHVIEKMHGKIRLSELQTVMQDYVAWKNNHGVSPSIYAEGRTRAQMYADGAALTGITPLPDDANLHELATDTLYRTVDTAWRVRVNNHYYRILNGPVNIIGQRVRINLGLDKSVTVVYPETGEIFATKDFRYLDDGEFRAQPQGHTDAAREAAAQFDGLAAPLRFAGAARLPENAVDLAAERVKRHGVFLSFDDVKQALSEASKTALGSLPENMKRAIDIDLKQLFEDGLLQQHTINDLAAVIRKSQEVL